MYGADRQNRNERSFLSDRHFDSRDDVVRELVIKLLQTVYDAQPKVGVLRGEKRLSV